MSAWSVKEGSEAIVPDGGILKLQLRPPKSEQPIPWARGTNTRLHYSVYAYLRGDEEQRMSVQHGHDHDHCDHDHDHGHDHGHCEHKNEHGTRASGMAAKTDMIEQLLGSFSAKKPKPSTKPSKQQQQQQQQLATTTTTASAADVATAAERSQPAIESSAVATTGTAVVSAVSTAAAAETQLDPDIKPIRKKIADSRDHDADHPFELRIGYNFSVEAMELCVKSLRVGERARFLCMPQYCEGFVQLETVLRQEKQNKINAEKGLPQQKLGGCCAHTSAELLSSNRDLMQIYGAPLEFDIELLEVQLPNSFEKQPWEMESLEKYLEVPLRKSEGGDLYRLGDFVGALAKYERALVLLESLSKSAIITDLKRERMELERNGGTPRVGTGVETDTSNEGIDLDVFNQLMQTCRLNYAACKIKLNDLPAAIVQCSEVLAHDPVCIKALFRRAQSYTKVGRDLDLASADLDKLEEILSSNPSKFPVGCSEWAEYHRERQLLDTKLKAYEAKERKMFGKMFG